MYIYHLHNYKQIGQEKYYDGVCIRFLLEDEIHAENNNLDFLDLIYGTASQYDLRSKIYPSFMTYRKWIELSKNYPALILSINFDTHSWKYKNFVKKILKYFPRNKRIIICAGNETYEKRGSTEKVYQTALEVYQAMQEIGKFYPIAFWNEKIYTSGEKEALEKLLNDPRVKEICEYFGFQSLGTSNSKVDKYVKLAKSKGFKGLDTELATLTKLFSEIEYKFKLDKELGIDDVVIMGSTIHKKLSDLYFIWGKYAHAIIDDQGNIIVKDKHKLIKHIQQFRTKEEGMKIADRYQKGDKDDRCIDLIQDMLKQLKYLQYPINFGDFDEKTKQAVLKWQKDNEVAQNGIVTKFHIWTMIEQQSNPESKMRQLIIYCS